jgi:hypothetical protein
MNFSANISKFFYILDTQPELFSPEQMSELQTLLGSVQDNSDEFNNKISAWCREHTEVRKAMRAISASTIVEFTPRFPNNAKPDSQTSKEDDRVQIDNILNAISTRLQETDRPSTNPSSQSNP